MVKYFRPIVVMGAAICTEAATGGYLRSILMI